MTLPLIKVEELAVLRDQVSTRAEGLAAELTWIERVEVRSGGTAVATNEIEVVVFNAERGTRFDGIQALFSEHPRLRRADVVLLSEVDWGMARSGNRHVARELAESLGYGYAFGVEFLELTKGEREELDAPGENTYSFHGNAILSRLPLSNARLLRLPWRCSWAAGSQLRIGGRMALLAEIDGVAGPITLASVHLENRTDPAGRRDQMRAVVDAIGPNHAAIVAGDLNTSTIDAGVDEQILSIPFLLSENPQRLREPEAYEPLFEDMRAAGFLIDEINPPGVPTNVPLGIPDPTYWLKLDWIFSRGVTPVAPAAEVIPAEHQGTRISDHDILVAKFSTEAV